ncbi:hypothetical protein V5799_018209, partial [Amblyomma americanum]
LQFDFRIVRRGALVSFSRKMNLRTMDTMECCIHKLRVLFELQKKESKRCV